MKEERPKVTGILAVQGDFAMHARMVERIGARWKLVKSAADLNGVDGLIIPGGETTTMLKFLGNDLSDKLREFSKPVFGTCAGAILLATEVLNPPQPSLGLIDISIERNAYGRQVDSAIRLGRCPELSAEPVEMVFIRAPIIRRVGKKVVVLGTADGLPVLVEQANVLAATFHPELTENETIHRYFLKNIDADVHRAKASS